MKQKFLSACLALACGFAALPGLAAEDGYTPLLNPAPGTVDFGQVQTGGASLSQLVVVANRGAGPVTYQGYSLTQATKGGLFDVFPQAGGTNPACAPHTVMAAGASCGLSVSFKPAAGVAGVGAKSAQLTPAFDATAPTGKGTVLGNSPGAHLLGIGVLPNGALAPAQLSFTLAAVGKDAAPQFLTLSNTGVGALTFLAAHLDSYDARKGRFTLSSAANGATPACNPRAPLAPEASCSVRVDFHSLAAGGPVGTKVRFDLADGAQAPAAVTVTGQVSAPTPALRRN